MVLMKEKRKKKRAKNTMCIQAFFSDWKKHLSSKEILPKPPIILQHLSVYYYY